MSYILDALRRAESERERGSVPRLHTPTLNGGPPPPPARRSGWTTAALTLALGLAVGLGWWLAPRATEAPLHPLAPTPSPTATPLSPAAARSALPTQKPNHHARAPSVNLGQPAHAVQAEAPVPTPEATPAPRVPMTSPSPQTTTTPPGNRVVAYEQLPPEVRRQLPNLQLGGAIYSETPSARMLLVNGQLLHEGDAAAPGVVLEFIRPRSAVLRWRDLRYEVLW